jgi:hypothetical protein
MTIVDCHVCGLPVEWDPSGKLDTIGITLESCEQHGLDVICNLCADMAEVEGAELEVIDQIGLKAYLEKDAA